LTRSSSDKLKETEGKQTGTYDATFKNEAVKLAEEIGLTKAAKELNIPQTTLNTWLRKAKDGTLPRASNSPNQGLNLAVEVKRLQQEVRELKRTNEILSKAAAFFAQSRKK
jgi:transposase